MGIKVSDIRYQYDNKKSEFDWVSILLIFVAIAIIIGTILFIFYFRKSKVEEVLEKETTISWISVENNQGKTESILLNFYNPKTNKLAVIVIPSRTRVKVEYEDKPTYDIVQNIYSRGGAGIVNKTIEKLTDSKFDFHFVYDLSDVERFVDLIEGLEVYNPNNLNYFDPQNSIFIKVPKGKVMLDGAKIKEFLLFKYGESGPKTMVDNHRIVAEAFLDRMEDIESLINNSRVAKILTKNLDTNLSKRDLKILVDKMKSVNSSRIHFYRMHGKNRMRLTLLL
jgi:LCP family protein required for cell wall assembly